MTVPAEPTPFVGRERELAALRGWLDALNAGQGAIALVAGDPGIGKTRTCEQLSRLARERGMLPLWGRCYEGEGAPAFWPWLQALRACLAARGADASLREMGAGAADIAGLLPELRELQPSLEPPASLEPAQARFRLFASIGSYLRAATAQQPLLVVIDDLHWADAPSLLLLRFLAHDLRDARLLIAATYREIEVEPGTPLAETIAALAREPHGRRLSLGGLDLSATARLTDHACGRSVAPALAAAVHHESEGNPFFITELAHLLAGEPRLEAAAAGRTDILAGLLPQSVREVIGRRLNRLSAPAHEALEAASVIGREFDLRTLAATSEIAVARLIDALAEAESAHAVQALHEGTGRYRFAHALVRETLYDGLPASRRMELHRRAGAALERLHHEGADGQVAALAHHFLRAAPLDPTLAELAVAYARLAAEHSLGQLAYEDAAGHYARSLEVLDLADSPPARPEQRCELLLALGDARGRAGDRDGARDALHRAATLARRLDSPAHLARAALGYAGASTIGRSDESVVTLLKEALARLGDGDSAAGARLLARLALELYWSPVPDVAATAQRTAEAAIAMARRVADPETLAFALYAGHYALWRPDNLDARLAIATELVQLGERLGSHAAARELALQGHHWRAADLLEQGEIAGVDAAIAAGERLATELRQPYYLWLTALWRAMRAALDGRFAGAERLTVEARALAERARRPDAAVTYSAQLFALRKAQGRLSELEPQFRELAVRFPELAVWRCALLLILAERDEPAAVREGFEQLAANRFAAVTRDALWVVSSSFVAEVCVYLGDGERSAVLYDALLPYAGRAITNGIYASVCQGSASRHLGLLAAALGRDVEASLHFEAALIMNERLGARPWLAYTQRDFAQMLWRRDAPGDRERALALARTAVQTAAALGMKGIDASLAPLLGSRPPSGRPGAADGLTPRELEVLRLIAGGRSNQEIADALVISQHTAVRHVSNILAKLGAANRAEAASYAAQHGLTT